MADNSQFEERMDLFLRDEMNAKEAEEFRLELDSDPLLKSEYEMNRSIVEGINTFRAAELKARLASITVSPFPVNFWAGIGSAAVVASITATLVYQNIDEPEADPVQENVVEMQAEESPAEENEALDLAEDSQISEAETEEVPAYTPPPAVNEPIEESENVEEEVSEETEGVTPTIQLPSGPGEEDGETKVVEEAEPGSNPQIKSEKKLDIDVKQHPEFNFHYQYSNHKLFIYGSLDKEPYRLLELKQSGKNNLYLAYDGKYYWLKDHTIKPEPLKPIRDRALLRSLRDLDSRN